MSEHKTIAGKIIEAIVSVFKANYLQFISKTYKKIPDDLKQVISNIIITVNNVAQSQFADMLVEIIPGEADDKLKEYLRLTLPIVIKSLALDEQELKGSQKALITGNLVKEYTGMELSQALITSQVVYKESFDK